METCQLKQAAHTATHYSSLSLADFVCATSLPSQTRYLRMKVDLTLRRAYQRVTGTDILDPNGHSEGNPIPGFTSALFGLKVSQGGGGFRPYMERMNFLHVQHLTPNGRQGTGRGTHGQGVTDLPL